MIYLLLLLLWDELSFFDTFFLSKKTAAEREKFLDEQDTELRAKLVEFTNLFIKFPFHHNEIIEYCKSQKFILNKNMPFDELYKKILNYQKQFYLQTNRELAKNPVLPLVSIHRIDYSKLSSNPSFNFLYTKSEFDLELKLMDLNYALNRDKMSAEQKKEFLMHRLLKIINKDKKPSEGLN